MIFEARPQVNAGLPSDNCQLQSNPFEDSSSQLDSARFFRAARKRDLLTSTGWHQSFLNALSWRQLLTASGFHLHQLIAGGSLVLETIWDLASRQASAPRAISI